MKKSIIFAAGALLTLGFSACNSDEPGNGGVAQKDEDRYLRVNIVNPTGSRADKFEAGTDEENAVKSMIMDFYDQSGNFVYRATPSDITTWTDPTADDKDHLNVGKIGSYIVKIGVEKNKNMPAYVMCYINPVTWTSESKSIPMADLRKELRTNYISISDGTEYFAMNNSCFYGTDDVTGNTNVKISGTPIKADLFFTSQKAAEDATDATVNIYVERYAAKVKFAMETTPQTEDYVTDATGIFPHKGTQKVSGADINYALTFTPEAWTINADAPEMYAVKNFQAVEGDPVASYTDVTNYLDPWATWNDKDNHRSYWSCSPAFFAKDFPEVSDQIADKAPGEKTGAGEVISPYALKYYSYDNICGTDGNGNTGFGSATESSVRYALENTMGKPAFESRNPKAAVPTVLIVGNYKVNYNGTDLADGTTFYVFDGGVYFDGTVTTPQVSILDKFIADQQILYVYDNVNKSYKRLTAENKGSAVFSVKHPAPGVRNEKDLVSERFVTLQLEEVPTDLYYIPTGGSYTKVNAGNLNEVNRLLWQQSGVAEAYTQGKCYFAIPIYHLGMTENTTNNPIKDGKLDWESLRVGDMGLVRNHVYDLQVSAITGRATGIRDLKYPIVPPMDQDEYWIKYQINILNWRIVPTQGGIVL